MLSSSNAGLFETGMPPSEWEENDFLSCGVHWLSLFARAMTAKIYETKIAAENVNLVQNCFRALKKGVHH